MARQEIIKTIQEFEKRIKADAKEANSILEIYKYLNKSQVRDVRLSALNSLRRIFCEFLESGRLCIDDDKTNEDSKKGNQRKSKSGDASHGAIKKGKAKEIKEWLKKQFSKFGDTLCGFISSGDSDMIAPSIRTMIEFTRREWLQARGHHQEQDSLRNESGANMMEKRATFGVRSFTALLRSLVFSEVDLDVELLLMLRSEIFDKADCRLYTWLILRKILLEIKHRVSGAAGTGSGNFDLAVAEEHDRLRKTVQNSLDVLRVLPFEEQEIIDSGEYLIERGSTLEYRGPFDGLDTLESDSDVSDDENDGYVMGSDDDDDDDEGGDSSSSKKRKATAGMLGPRLLGASGPTKRKRKGFNKMTRAEQVGDASSHQKVFSRAWLSLLALPMSRAQHKLVLKHLPDHVISRLSNPLLLADYLTRSYEVGGSTAVLALSSLFTLIVAHNLDYPEFFPSLYRLCTVDNFSAKYRAKFMSLLGNCLKSVNLQAYAVAAFAKRLMRLALVVPSPSALYCVAQVTWLLRNHPQCIVLLQRGELKGEGTGAGAQPFVDEYDAKEEVSLEKCKALQSSLWEALGLHEHHLHSVATLSKALESHLSTENSVKAPYLRVDDFLGHTYEALMETELALAKKNSALTYAKPATVLSGVTGSLFGA